jgi:hypothetical protein
VLVDDFLPTRWDPAEIEHIARSQAVALAGRAGF